MYLLHVDESNALANVAGRKQITSDDVLLAVKYNLDACDTTAPPRELLLQVHSFI